MSGEPFDWSDLLGQHRTIAIHAPIVQWTGDYHAAALFEELVWRWKAAGERSFTVLDAALMEKLCLTIRNLRTARARLIELGAIATERRGAPRVLHYSVDLTRVERSLSSTLVTKRHQRRLRNVTNVDDETASTSILQNGLTELRPEYGLTPTSKDDVGATGANDAPVGAPGDARSTGPAVDPQPEPEPEPKPAPAPEPAPEPEPERAPKPAPKRRAKRQHADRVPLGPGSEIYRDVVHLTPNSAQRPLLDEAYATLGESDLRFYLTRWLAHGWSPKNVPGMVDFALARGQSKPPAVVGSSLNGQSPPTNGNRGPVTVIPGVRL